MNPADNLQYANNWITGVGVAVNICLTGAIIWLTSKTANSARDSATAADNSYKLNQQIIEQQNEKENKVTAFYRKHYKRKILLYAEETHQALLKAFQIEFNGNTKDITVLRTIPPFPNLEIEDLALYFEYEEIEPIYIAAESLASLQEYIAKNIGYNTYDENSAGIRGTDLIRQYEVMIRHFS